MQLAAYLKSKGKTPDAPLADQVETFARKMKVDPRTVYAWMAGSRFPHLNNMKRIALETRGAVTLNDWAEAPPAKRPKGRPRRRHASDERPAA
jgi:transcriptional regulator with XRE-family HTH domain